MPERDPHCWGALIAWLVSEKERAVPAALAAVMAWMRGRYTGRPGYRALLDALMCALLAWFVRDALDALGISTDLSYLASIVIGYLGIDYLGGLLRQKISLPPPLVKYDKKNDEK